MAKKKTNVEIKWIKIATNIFADEKIMLIEQMPDADTIIVIWFKLLCMAGKENNCGVFVMGGKIPYTDEMLAAIFRRPLPTIRLALKTFEDFGMIEIIEDSFGNEVFAIPNWEKHQNVDGMDRIREQTRQRVAKHRENQRLSLGCNDTCNVTVTECNATEKEKEEEKEEEKEKEKEKEKNIVNHNIILGASLVPDDDLNKAILSFVNHRKTINKPMTDDAIQLLIEELKTLSPDTSTQIKILYKSIMNGWQGIFPLTEENKQPNKNNQRQYDYNELERKLLAKQAEQKANEDP